MLDTGDGQQTEYIDLLKTVLSENHVTLDQIILTHWHPDHIGGVELIHKQIGKCSVGKFYVDDKPANFDELHHGQEVKIEGASLKIYHTPGHTTDHVVLHLQEEDAVFSGDCILGEGTAVFEDLYDYMKSLEQILKISPKVIYPGHGPVVDDPIQKIQYYITHRNQRETQIMEHLTSMGRNGSSGNTAMDLVRSIYTELDPTLYGAAEHNVLMHLRKLKKDGKVANCANNISLWSSM